MPNGSMQTPLDWAMASRKSAAVSSSHLGESFVWQGETTAQRATSTKARVNFLNIFPPQDETQLAFSRQLAFPTRIAIKTGILAPIQTREAIQIPNDKAIANGHLTYKFLVSFELAAEAVNKSEIPLFDAKNGDVCVRANGKISEFFVMNFARRICGGAL